MIAIPNKENDMGVIKVEHPNGYLGILYGESSMSIYDESGHEVLHTGNRNVNTEAELNELLEGMPDFVEIMADIVLDDEVDICQKCAEEMEKYIKERRTNE